ncbi:MAG: hypothetical protein ACWA49_06620 [Ruegeria sp.]
MNPPDADVIGAAGWDVRPVRSATVLAKSSRVATFWVTRNIAAATAALV